MSNNFFEDDDAETYILDVDDDIQEDENENIICAIDDELMRIECDRKTFKFEYNDDILSGVPIKKIDDNNIIFLINGKLKKIKMELATFN